MFFIRKVSGLIENLHIGICSETINVVKVKHSMMVVLPLFFIFCTCSREIIVMFSDLTKTLILAHCLKEAFQTLHDYYLARGLPIYTRFDDLDLIPKLQVCQNHKLQIVVKLLSTVV